MTRLTISDTQLSMMRATIPLPDTAVISAQSQTYNDAGMGGAITWTPVSGGTVLCRLDPAQSNDQTRVVGAGETTVTEHQLTMPYDAPLSENNRVTISGRVYEVTKLDDVHSWNVSVRARVSEIR